MRLQNTLRYAKCELAAAGPTILFLENIHWHYTDEKQVPNANEDSIALNITCNKVENDE